MTIHPKLSLSIEAMCIATFLFLASGCHKNSLVAPSVPRILHKDAYTYKDYQQDLTNYEAELDGDNDRETLMDLRNKIAYGVMTSIDGTYGQFTRNLYTGKADVAVAGDSLVLGLTAASTIATHTPTKTILSALSTAFTGVNLTVDKNFFAQQTYQTIAIAMQTRRDKARTTIIQNLWDDAEDYPLEAAKRDLMAYFYAGTLPGGLQELQEEAGSAAKAQTTEPKTGIH